MGDNNLNLSSLDREEVPIEDMVKDVLAKRFNHKRPMPPEPEYAITIGGKGLVESGGSLISCLGLPKTRKSSVAAMIVASALSEDKKHGIIETPHIDGHVLWFDTEMGLHRELPRFHNHVVDMAGRRGDEHDDYLWEHYHVINLRPYSHSERLAIIDNIVMHSDLRDNIGLMVLDGVADLISSTNDLSESKEVMDRILKWSDFLKCPTIVCLHLAHSTKRGQGFAGNFLANKGSYSIQAEVEYDGSPSLIKAGMTRNGQRFEPFKISNIEYGEPNAGRPIFVDDEADLEPTFNTNRTSIKHVDDTENFF